MAKHELDASPFTFAFFVSCKADGLGLKIPLAKNPDANGMFFRFSVAAEYQNPPSWKNLPLPIAAGSGIRKGGIFLPNLHVWVKSCSPSRKHSLPEMEQLLHPILFTEIIGLYHFGIKRMKNRKMDAGFLDLRKTACFHGFMNAGGILWPWPSAGNRRFYLNITPRSRAPACFRMPAGGRI